MTFFFTLVDKSFQLIIANDTDSVNKKLKKHTKYVGNKPPYYGVLGKSDLSLKISISGCTKIRGFGIMLVIMKRNKCIHRKAEKKTKELQFQQLGNREEIAGGSHG